MTPWVIWAIVCRPMLQPCASTTARSVQTSSASRPPRWAGGTKWSVKRRSLSTSMSRSGSRIVPHLLGQPSLQVAEPRLRRGVQRLGGVRGQVPAVLIHRGVGVGGRRLEEEVVGRVQPLRQMSRGRPWGSAGRPDRWKKDFRSGSQRSFGRK